MPAVFLLGLPLALVSAASMSCVPRSSAASSRSLQGDLYAGVARTSRQDWMATSRIFRQARAVGGPKKRKKDTKKQVQVQKERKKRDNVIELDGKVMVHSRNLFKVLLSNGAEVQCTLAGKLRMNNIKVMEGDAVTVEMSPFDLTKGRIVFRTIKMPGEEDDDTA
ncbi:infA [Symbiodinium natans]|uniref:InfA protein n=1 Tax=Symbiodinium natans TaxID=878477 RepID=A0A812J5L7_9DINO|nr:infA [Symbiodinium natans]